MGWLVARSNMAGKMIGEIIRQLWLPFYIRYFISYQETANGARNGPFGRVFPRRVPSTMMEARNEYLREASVGLKQSQCVDCFVTRVGTCFRFLVAQPQWKERLIPNESTILAAFRLPRLSVAGKHTRQQKCGHGSTRGKPRPRRRTPCFCKRHKIVALAAAAWLVLQIENSLDKTSLQYDPHKSNHTNECNITVMHRQSTFWVLLQMLVFLRLRFWRLLAHPKISEVGGPGSCPQRVP